jgi:hypothetical protein
MKEYWLHVDDWGEEHRYHQPPPSPLDTQVLHVWVEDEFEITKTWKRSDPLWGGRLRYVFPRGVGWELYDDKPKDHSVWRRRRRR